MRLERAIKIEQRAIQQLRTIFRVCREMEYNSNCLSEQCKEVFDKLTKDFAISRRITIVAVRNVLSEEMYERDLIPCYLQDGKIYTFHKGTKFLDARKMGNDIGNFTFKWHWRKNGGQFS